MAHFCMLAFPIYSVLSASAGASPLTRFLGPGACCNPGDLLHRAVLRGDWGLGRRRDCDLPGARRNRVNPDVLEDG